MNWIFQRLVRSQLESWECGLLSMSTPPTVVWIGKLCCHLAARWRTPTSSTTDLYRPAGLPRLMFNEKYLPFISLNGTSIWNKFKLWSNTCSPRKVILKRYFERRSGEKYIRPLNATKILINNQGHKWLWSDFSLFFRIQVGNIIGIDWIAGVSSYLNTLVVPTQVKNNHTSAIYALGYYCTSTCSKLGSIQNDHFDWPIYFFPVIFSSENLVS